jgi:asparagine synthase (glutamine-hydrolysing)
MGFGEETDEFKDARMIAERFGTDHRELSVDSSQAMKLYPRMIWHMETPKYNLYPWFVCELVHKYVKVCLSGNGGDEVFGGYYARYQNALRIQELARKPYSGLLRAPGQLLQTSSTNMKTQNRLRVLQSLGDNVSEYLILAGVLPDSFNAKLFKGEKASSSVREHFAPYFERVDFLQGLMNAEIRTKLVDDLLSVDDTMSMANSLELRVPLLDNRIVDLMARVPWQLKYAQGTHGKLLLRKVVSKILPAESLRKPKWGFSVNVQAWYNGELGELVKQTLPESEVLQKYFDMRTVRRLVEHTTGNAEYRRSQVLLWQMLGFHLWHRIFIESENVDAAKLQVEALVA